MRIKSLLRRLYPAPPAANPDARDALEAKLMASFPTPTHPPSRGRWAMGFALGAAGLVGACVVPADYELSMGHRMVVELQMSCGEFNPEALATHVKSEFEITQLMVGVRCAMADGQPESEGEVQLVMDLVGDISTEAVEVSLVESFPELADASIEFEALDGTVHGTLGGLLSKRALGLELLDRGSAEQTRALILAELAERGFEGTATVDVDVEEEITPLGRRVEIRVEVAAETGEPPEPSQP